MIDEANAEFTEEEKAVQRAVARALFQIDRKMGEEAGQPTPEWPEAKGDYLKRGSRLIRTFKRQGLEIVTTGAFES